MKVKNDNELWLQNPGTADVNVGDLGVKIRVGQTANVYEINPYLTTMQVEQSLKSGSLYKRLTNKALKVVSKKVNAVPHGINQIKASDQPVTAKKTKTSVVIEQTEEDPEEMENFGFADYGINDLGPDVSQTKQPDGAVVVEAKQDTFEEEKQEEVLDPIFHKSGIDKQSQMVMKKRLECETDPTGPFAENATARQPFAVIKPPKDEEHYDESVPEFRNEVRKDPETGMIVVDTEKEGRPRSIKKIKKAQDNDVDDYSVPDDDQDGADDVVEFEASEFDAKMATKTEDGAIVMKIKEEEPEADS